MIPRPYEFGKLKLTLNPDGRSFTMVGTVHPTTNESDHFQLIYEALTIASHTSDPYASEMADFVAELMSLSENWDEEAS